MGNILLEYINKNETIINKTDTPGPVITISREFGCYASALSGNLVKAISKESKNNWNYITKEVLEDAAKKLNVRKEEIAHIFGANEKNFLGDLVISFAKRKYASDSHIKKTITDVVRKYAEQGNSIIVGRAGCVIAKDIKQALHVRIIAPFEFRVNEIAKAFKLDKKDAAKLVGETDEKRQKFMSFFKGNEPDSKLFHVVYNKSMLSESEIIKSIVELAKYKKLI